jgi:hypothetical protein
MSCSGVGEEARRSANAGYKREAGRVLSTAIKKSEPHMSERYSS